MYGPSVLSRASVDRIRTMAVVLEIFAAAGAVELSLERREVGNPKRPRMRAAPRWASLLARNR